ncbi:MAG: hypothetical protein M3281_03125, partial [Chloroflexota bacterium]|nr:hypothetical protein [Chloroflexota bacterium]
LDIVLTPQRTASGLRIAGQIVPREDVSVPDQTLVELLDTHGVVASLAFEDSFEFNNLRGRVYNLRISGSRWKVGIFGVMG